MQGSTTGSQLVADERKPVSYIVKINLPKVNKDVVFNICFEMVRLSMTSKRA